MNRGLLCSYKTVPQIEIEIVIFLLGNEAKVVVCDYDREL